MMNMELASPARDSVNDYVAPHWSHAALVVIDVQNDFLDDGVSAIPGTSAVVPRIAALAAAFRAAGRPVVHVVRFYEPGGSDVDLPRRDAVERGAFVAAPGSPGSQIPTTLLPGPTLLDAPALRAGTFQQLGDDEVVLFKPRWSAFHRTALEEWLRERGIDTVVVAGCNLPNCPRATLFDASERDFRTVLVRDAVSQTSEERLADCVRIGVTVADSEQVTTRLAELAALTS